MSNALNSVWNIIYGFLTNKVFTTENVKNKISGRIAKHLKGGDVTDEECRRLIITKISQIESKLDGLARKDLLSSVCYLQEGINRVVQSVRLRENSSGQGEQATSHVTEATTAGNVGRNSNANEAVAVKHMVTSMKICSNESFKSATESFKLARTKATEAFCNQGLSVEHRIEASRIRVLSRILESLDDPDGSVSDCLQYLKQLHDISAIKETFTVQISGGIKASFYHTKRLELISSIQILNQTLFDFAKVYMKLPTRTFEWPTILHGNEIYHPLLGESNLVEKLEESGVNVSLPDPDLTFDDRIYRKLSVVNSKGDILAHMQNENKIKILKPSEGNRVVCNLPEKDSFSECGVVAMDIDVEDNIYFISRFRETANHIWSFKLSIFDANGQLESLLPFQNISLTKVNMTISKDGKVAILNCEEKCIYIGTPGLGIHTFEFSQRFSVNELFTKEWTWLNLRFMDSMIVAANEHTIYIFKVDGTLLKKHEVFQREGNEFIHSVVINYITNHIVIKSWSTTSRYRLLSFSSTGIQKHNLCLGPSKWIEYAELISHPNGPMALVSDTEACILQMYKAMHT